MCTSDNEGIGEDSPFWLDDKQQALISRWLDGLPRPKNKHTKTAGECGCIKNIFICGEAAIVM